MTKVNTSKYVGSKVHRLTVLDLIAIEKDGKSVRYFTCICDCGTEKLVHYSGISKGRIKSCGCWKKEVDSRKAKSMGDKNHKHGMSRTRIYKSWDCMIQRCTNPNQKGYEHYGGRGITFDPRWSNFVNFYNDMHEGYKDSLTIERIDVDGNYCKDNCTWITMFEQQGNKQRSPKNKLKRLRRLNGGII